MRAPREERDAPVFDPTRARSASLPLPPWIAVQARGLLQQRGHAWLLQGPSGLGQYALALELARAWLCDQPHDGLACGHCPSCHGVAVRTHADLCVLMPEVLLLAEAWPLSEAAQAELDAKSRKPSREIRVDALRSSIEFAQRTSSRGRGKVVVVYPAEDMNAFSANALLKTLEEPVGDVRFVLASNAAHQLLPTIRSRCLVHTMVWPHMQEALDWLIACGLSPEQARDALRASGGRADDALTNVQSGRAAVPWDRLPPAVQMADVAFFKDWPAVEVLDALQKLCHDCLCLVCGAPPKYFLPESLPKGCTLATLTAWSRALVQSRRTIDHPYGQALLLEALLAQAQQALYQPRPAASARGAQR